MLAALAEILASPADPSGGDGPRVPGEDDCYPKQWGPVSCEARFFAVCAARQVGKTDAIRKRARRCLAQPGKKVIYATLIRRNCKKFFWWPVLEELAKDGWDVSEANGSDLILTLPNGAWMQALSCSEMSDLKTIRGDQADEFFVDECQEPNDDVLETLAMKIAPSMLMKRGGTLSLWGTVPEVEPCFFSRKLDDPRWTAFGHSFDPDGNERSAAWSTFDNPFIDEDEIRLTNEEAGLGPGHPIYERETMGRRVKDPEKFAYEYQAGRNDYDPGAIEFERGKWRHSAGLDLGHGDCDAIVVHGWPKDQVERGALSRFSWAHNKLDVDDLADVISLVQEVYRPQWVGDTGGHGAVKVLKTLEGRLGMIFAPKPPDVPISVRLINDDYRTGRLKHPTADIETSRLLQALEARDWEPERKERIRTLLLKGATPVTDEVGRVSKSVNPRTKKVEINKTGIHSDISEANRYAHAAARHWAAKPPKVEKQETRDERRDRQWREQQRREHDPWR